MLDCNFFYEELVRKEIDFFAGVPDSLLRDFCDYLLKYCRPNNHIIAANEGGAVAIACGHYLATGRPGLVYMQNSGQGNALNPLVSLADEDVYSIPLMLLIGWRGEPGTKDEPQHIKQGKITTSLLDTLQIPYRVLPETNEEAKCCVEWATKTMEQINAPVALIVKKGTFNSHKLSQYNNDNLTITREDAIKAIVSNLEPTDILVSTTGKTSRELYEYRDSLSSDHSKDFLTVGSMGHASQIALGIALAKPKRQVFCFDGDGAAIMHLGALAIAGPQKIKNFKHIIFNNGCHDSVGGQPTSGFFISFTDIARGCGYTITVSVQNLNEIKQSIEVLKDSKGPSLLEIKVKKGSRSDLGRPKVTPRYNKASFMEFLSD